MARPKKDPNKAPTKDRILLAAEDEFGAHGFHGANLADIAEHVGIRRPSLLYHFSDKGSLYTSVVRNGFLQLRMAVLKGMAFQGTFEERTTAIVRELVALSEKRRPLIQIFARELVDASEKSEQVFEELGQLIDQLVLFMESQQDEHVRHDIPTRAAIHALIASYLLRATGRAYADRLWDGGDPTEQLARVLLLQETK